MILLPFRQQHFYVKDGVRLLWKAKKVCKELASRTELTHTHTHTHTHICYSSIVYTLGLLAAEHNMAKGLHCGDLSVAT